MAMIGDTYRAHPKPPAIAKASSHIAINPALRTACSPAPVVG